MNCKPGDLAVIVGGYRPENIGSIVSVLRRYDGTQWAEFGPAWVVKQQSTGITGHCDDKFLRPIRDQDGEDEILRLVGKPETEQA